jgi:serine/threonine protein kinase
LPSGSVCLLIPNPLSRPENILLMRPVDERSPDLPPIVRIADFGLAEEAPGEQKSKGVHDFQSPEYARVLLIEKEYLKPQSQESLGIALEELDSERKERLSCIKGDLWALGVTFYKLLTKKSPFKGSDDEILHDIFNGPNPVAFPEITNRYKGMRNIHIEIQNLVIVMLDRDPENRLKSIDRVVEILEE